MENKNTHSTKERVILVRNQSRRSLLLYYLFSLFFLFLAVYSLKNKNIMENLSLFPYMFFIILFVLLVLAEKNVRYTKFTVTDKRAVYKEGIIKKHIRTIRYASITDISSKQNLFQRILNYGDLNIMTSGAKKDYELSIKNISGPDKVRTTVEKFVLSSKHHL